MTTSKSEDADGPPTPGGALDGPDAMLVEELVAASGMRYWNASEGVLLEVGDMETQFAVAARSGRFLFEDVQRGRRRTVAEFSSIRAAQSYLILTLAEAARADRGLPPIRHRRLAPRTELVDGPEGQRLTWPGGWALFARGRRGEVHALPFSWAVQVSPAEIAASYGHVNGEPLFDLGITDPQPWLDPQPMVSTLKPRPAEVPPPDPDASDEDAVVAETAVEIGWTPQPAEAADLLAVGQDGVGRLICYRHGSYQYQSFVRDQRSITATFTSAGAARRFLVMEIGAIWRLRQPGFRIIRIHRPGPGFTVTKGPTELEVSWAGGTATFNLGYVGQQQALTFTWCAHASLTDIATSYRDRNGAPLFDLEDEDQHRPPWHP